MCVPIIYHHRVHGPLFCHFPPICFGQDCERSFNANLRISVVQTSGPVGSASAVIAISVLPLLLFSASSSSATYFIQVFASSTLWAVLLSLLHGLLLTPTLLLVFRENLTTRPRSTTLVAGSWCLGVAVCSSHRSLAVTPLFYSGLSLVRCSCSSYNAGLFLTPAIVFCSHGSNCYIFLATVLPHSCTVAART